MKKLLLVVFGIILFSLNSCNEESHELIQSEESKSNDLRDNQDLSIVKHNYDLYGEKFEVIYTLDNNSEEIVNIEGDIDMASQVFENEETAPKSFYIDQIEEYENDEFVGLPSLDYLEVNIKLFREEEEVELYLSELAREERDLTFDTVTRNSSQQRSNCNSHIYYFPTHPEYHTNYLFFYHINYNAEMTGLRRSNVHHFHNHWVGNSYNDHLSSFYFYRPQAWYNNRDGQGILLYEHSCFDGRRIALGVGRNTAPGYYGVSDLRRFTLWSFLWWGKSWNDQVSSIKAYYYN